MSIILYSLHCIAFLSIAVTIPAVVTVIILLLNTYFLLPVKPIGTVFLVLRGIYNSNLVFPICNRILTSRV